MTAFTHLHVHSQYSLLDGLSTIDGLVDRCLETGMNSIAITDHGNMYGIKEFHDYVAKKNSKTKDAIEALTKELEATTDPEKQEELTQKIAETKKKIFKPLFGCETYMTRQTNTNPTGSRLMHELKENSSGYHLILIAKNETGYHNLCKLVSSAFIDGFYSRPRIDRELLEQYHDGLIVSSACLAGEIPKALENNDYDKAKEVLLWYKNIFGEDFYLEIQRHQTDKPGGDTTVYERQQAINTDIIKLAKETNTKLIATNDVHFIREEDAEAHDHLICMSMNHKINDENRIHYTKQEWLKSPEEMEAIFSDIPEALTNTQEIVAKVENFKLKHAPIMPIFDIPKDFGTTESYKEKFSEEDLRKEFEPDDASKGRIEKLGGLDKVYRIKLEADYLQKLTYQGATKRYGDPVPEDICERIDFELSVMRNMGFPGYFLIVQDFIAAARNMGVSVGPGRGSAAGSVVAYCLKITDVDPLKYDLLFERFLNPDRISLPDIDVDFDDDGRYKILDWITEKYGKEKVAHIITYGTMATKSSIKDVARVEDLDLTTSNALAKLIPDKLPEDPKTKKAPKINLKNCLELVPELKNYYENGTTKIKDVLNFAKQLEGTVRQIGIHACGVIIGADDLTKFAPLSTVKDKETGDNIIVTQYEGKVVEDVGLIKMDFLGLRTLSIIKDAIANIKKSRGIDVDIDAIPIDDPLTYELYSRGDTIATFQFESPGMQKYLRELKPSKFEDLIAMNALYRPGPMDYIPDFIDRKLGRKPVKYDIPCMEKYLKDTYGITVYQEQVMLLSRQLANFTRGQSDTLRKAMGKKLIDKMNELEVLFYEGGEKNGHDKKVLQKIWEDWKKFASYAFNKSHATCYSWVAYQTGYLKAHYPAEFMAANLTNNLSDIAKISVYIEDAQKKGITVLGPDVNESELQFSVNKDGNIRFGLAALKGVGESAAASVLKEREENGPFKDIFDFITRVDLRSCNKKAIESMAYTGAFDSLPNIHRAQFFHEDKENKLFLDKLVTFGTRSRENANSQQTSIFDDVPEMQEMANPSLPQCDEMSHSLKLRMEKEVAGFYISGHPLDPYKAIIDNYTNTTLEQISNHSNYEKMANKQLKFVAMTVDYMSGRTKKNDTPFCKITLEDYENTFSEFFYGETAAKFEHFLKNPGELLFFNAEISTFNRKNKEGNYEPNYKLTLTNVFYLSEAFDKLCKSINLRLSNCDISVQVAYQLKEIIHQSEGDIPLYIHVSADHENFFCIFDNIQARINPQTFLKNIKSLNIPYKLELK